MSIGDIHFTGNEEGGGCWYCGGDLPKRRRRWCCDDHMYQYWENYNWTMAAAACLRETKHTCANCHRAHKDIFDAILAEHGWGSSFVDAQIEIHHIIPMGGEDRQWHVLNR